MIDHKSCLWRKKPSEKNLVLDDKQDPSYKTTDQEVPGGTMRDSFLVDGVAFKKTFSYAGFEQQPKKFLNPKILLLNIELELKSEKENAEIRLTDPSQYQSIVDAEWNIIYDKLDNVWKVVLRLFFHGYPLGIWKHSILLTEIFSVLAVSLKRTCNGSQLQLVVQLRQLSTTSLKRSLILVKSFRSSKLEMKGLIYSVDAHVVGPPLLFSVVEQIRCAIMALHPVTMYFRLTGLIPFMYFIQFIDESERSLHDVESVFLSTLMTNICLQL